jgi:putative oxidoreductase
MNPVRRLARILLSSMFITDGLDALLRPEAKAPLAEPVAPALASTVTVLPENPEQLVRVNGAVQIVAGLLLALGRLPRLSALALAATLVPTTAVGHRFWEAEDKGQRKAQQIHFFKNLSMLGGLLLAAMDTEGRPGLAWRAQHAVEHAGAAAKRTRREAQMAAKTARREARLAAKAAKATAREKIPA